MPKHCHSKLANRFILHTFLANNNLNASLASASECIKYEIFYIENTYTCERQHEVWISHTHTGAHAHHVYYDVVCYMRWMHELKRNFEWHELIKLCYMRLCAFAVTRTHITHTFCCNSTLISPLWSIHAHTPFLWMLNTAVRRIACATTSFARSNRVKREKNETKTEILFQEFTRIVYKYIYAPCVRVCERALCIL